MRKSRQAGTRHANSPSHRRSLLRLLVAALALFLGFALVPAAANAATCAGATSAAALRDTVVDAKVHSSKLNGAKAKAAILELESGIASASKCRVAGSVEARAANLAVIAQLRWNWACVLSYDGVAADKSHAIELAKSSDADMDAFMSRNASESEDARVLFQNWEHFDGDIESGRPDSCLE